MALVWISPLQARVSSMVEALEILSSLISKGSDWPYVLIQLYEGANHMPLLKDKHICILPQEKVESPSGQISQLKFHWLLLARPLVIQHSYAYSRGAGPCKSAPRQEARHSTYHSAQNSLEA